MVVDKSGSSKIDSMGAAASPAVCRRKKGLPPRSHAPANHREKNKIKRSFAVSDG